MSITITINGSSAAELASEVQALAEALSVRNLKVVKAAPTIEEPKKEEKSKTKAKPETNKPDPEPVVEEETVQEEVVQEETTQEEVVQEEVTEPENIPSVVDLRAVAQEKGKTPGGKKAIKALLDQFGSRSISDVPEASRAAFLAELEAI